MRAWMLLIATVGAAGCGGGGGGNRTIDAAPAPDVPEVDAPDAPPPDAAPPPCNYTEKSDASNDPTGDPGTEPKPEATMLTIGSAPQILCGAANTGHFNPDTMTVDADAYRVTVGADANLVVRFTGGPEAAAAAVDFSIFVFTTEDSPLLLFGGRNNPLIRDHGAFLITLAAGTYDVVVTVNNSADLAAPFDYKVQIAPDGPTRCAAVAAPAAYTEAADGTGAGNDVVSIDFDNDPFYQLTASATDAAEPTGLTIDGSNPVRITGSSADEDAEDDYMDRDTYLVRTGPATHEITLRLGWADEHTDLNYVVFPADQTDHLDKVGDGLQFAGHEEYNVVAVKPSSAYWIWVGSHDESTGLPATYDLSICGTTTFR
jgi:hypothetical protein